ncbi:hypothetical protein BS78_04G242300 [Paspalum vaginatum]|nr:hypothetical protein BS78_04G242300 [Paspalum vaginatum]
MRGPPQARLPRIDCRGRRLIRSGKPLPDSSPSDLGETAIRGKAATSGPGRDPQRRRWIKGLCTRSGGGAYCGSKVNDSVFRVWEMADHGR